MMKRTVTIVISAIVLALAPSSAAGRGEKVLLATDRKVYVAGDRLLCSAFCLDSSGSLSAGSGVAYVEVHNTSGMVQTAKIALSGGRGACGVYLPGDIPTGNYAVLAYTVSGCADGVVPEPVVISVFNTTSSARVESGVKILPRGWTAPAESAEPLPEGVGVSVEGDSLVAVNGSSRPVSLSIGASLRDRIPDPRAAEAIIAWPEGRPHPTLPEYEGEIISGRIVGLDPTQLKRLQGKSVFISAPGGTADIYSAPLRDDGTFSIFTSNLFGRTDLVCEVENMPSGMAGHVELESPFVDWKVSGIAPLELCEDWSADLERRDFASQVERRFSLCDFDRQLEFPRGWDFGDEAVVYDLDDYTRFPTMKEVFTEFIPEIRWHGNDREGYTIGVRVFDAYGGNARYSEESSLMMVDGIPVFDKGRIIDYDPLLVKTIRIYPYQYYLGERSFEGVVDFITYKRNAPTLAFDADVRVVDWDGTGVPFTVHSAMDATGPGVPDYRQTVLWQPCLELSPGERRSFRLPEGLPLVISAKALAL